MPTIKLQSQSHYSPYETYQRVRNFIENDPGLRKLDSSYTTTFNDADKMCLAKGKQFSANLKVCEESAGARVDVTVELPFILTPLKGQVQSTLEKKLQQALA